MTNEEALAIADRTPVQDLAFDNHGHDLAEVWRTLSRWSDKAYTRRDVETYRKVRRLADKVQEARRLARRREREKQGPYHFGERHDPLVDLDRQRVTPRRRNT